MTNYPLMSFSRSKPLIIKSDHFSELAIETSVDSCDFSKSFVTLQRVTNLIVAVMKHIRFIGDRWPAVFHNGFLAGLLLVAVLATAGLVASATGNLPAGDVRGKTGHGDEVYLSVDRMPAFPGGEAALMTYLRDNISYPLEAEEKNIQGKVIVQFVVDSAGYVGDVKVVRSVDPNLDREAVRVIQTLPKFIPGARLGKPVNVWYTLPVNFVINNDISYLLSFIHEIDSIKIDYCNLNIDTPMAITPDNYDAGQFSQSRKTVLIKRKWKIKEMVNALGGLAKLSQGHLDTRGKIYLYFNDGKKSVAYYDQNSLYYRGNYYDITTFTAAGAEFRKILFPLIQQTE